VLAAAGNVALETMIERLSEDHARARRLAAGLASIPGVELDPGSPQTNMVFISLSSDVPVDADGLASSLARLGVLVGVVAARRFRLVTHYWIDDAAVDQAVQAFAEVLRATARATAPEYRP
jgi:threonine aldolase